MAVDLSALAGSVGIPVETFRNGLGAVLNFLKERLPGNLFGEVHEKVPEAQAMMDSAAAAPGAPGATAGGGILGAAAKLIAGAGGIGALLTKLQSLGLSMEQITAFLGKALELMKAYLPPNLLEKVVGAVKQEG